MATLDPASNISAILLQLAEASVNLFRLNMSRGSHDIVAKLNKAVRDAKIRLQRPIGILADLQGPKIRCGVFGGGLQVLGTGAAFPFGLDDAQGDYTLVTLPHGDFPSSASWRVCKC